MTPIDTYRDAFLKFIAEGMTHADALAEFNEEEFRFAMMAEVFNNEARIDPVTKDWVTNDVRKLPALFQLCCIANRQRSDARDFEEQAVPLMLAGWTSEVPSSYRTNSTDVWRQCPVMSLYWRAPSKRPTRPGRRYLSTNQAFNAMQRAQGR